jgi:hypothetical protein
MSIKNKLCKEKPVVDVINVRQHEMRVHPDDTVSVAYRSGSAAPWGAALNVPLARRMIAEHDKHGGVGVPLTNH